MTKWSEYLKQYRAKHPNMAFADAQKNASIQYKKDSPCTTRKILGRLAKATDAQKAKICKILDPPKKKKKKKIPQMSLPTGFKIPMDLIQDDGAVFRRQPKAEEPYARRKRKPRNMNPIVTKPRGIDPATFVNWNKAVNFK